MGKKQDTEGQATLEQENADDLAPAAPSIGHNSGEPLKSFIERVERLEEEKAAIAADIKEVYAEAKGTGFDTKIMRQVVRLRKIEPNDRVEQQAILDAYMHSIGMDLV